MLSDSEEENPFILEEPAITSTFSAARRQQYKMVTRTERNPESPNSASLCSQPPQAQHWALNENVIVGAALASWPREEGHGCLF